MLSGFAVCEILAERTLCIVISARVKIVGRHQIEVNTVIEPDRTIAVVSYTEAVRLLFSWDWPGHTVRSSYSTGRFILSIFAPSNGALMSRLL